MTLPKIHSITKKICVALLGLFLLFFLLFHACANLCILRHDGGAWYGDFCHFMGSNYIVKVFEIVLLGFILLHMALTLWLWFCNTFFARPVGYHQPSRSKTHAGSKLQIWTGLLIFVCLILHFTDFYFVKIGWVKGQYMVKTEKLHSEELNTIMQATAQYGITPEEFISANEQQFEMYKDQLDKFRAVAPVVPILNRAEEEHMFSDDHQWLKQLTIEDKEILEAAIDGLDAEPDFYNLTREKFKDPVIALLYILFFVIVWFHLRHAFAAAFQTLGLNNYKYSCAIEVIGQIYTWFVCLCFAIVVILVFFGM